MEFLEIINKVKKTRLILLLAGIVLITLGNIIGVSDNPPGIILAYIGIIIFATAFVYDWTKIKKLITLIILSVLGFPLFALLHNLFHAWATLVTELIIIKSILEILGVIFFLAALFICPAGFFAGITGIIINITKKKRIK
jgi:hypothetical protein